MGSPFLNALQAGEKALPGMVYATFGGISVRLTRLLTWWYTLGSALPQWHWPSYHLELELQEYLIGGCSPVLDGALVSQVLGLFPEFRQGEGDILTTDATSRLSHLGAQHKSNWISHAEALWDPGLQLQVLEILERIWNDGVVVRQQSDAAVYVIFGGAKFWIPNPTELQNYGGWSAVKVVPDGALDYIPTTPREGTVLRERSAAAVYLMRNQQKCWIPSATVLANYGDWEAVKVVPDHALDKLPEGPTVS